MGLRSNKVLLKGRALQSSLGSSLYARCPVKVLRFINNRTKALCLMSEMFFVLDKRDTNLNFDILFFSFG